MTALYSIVPRTEAPQHEDTERVAPRIHLPRLKIEARLQLYAPGT